MECQHYCQAVASLPLESHCTSLSGFFQKHLVGCGRWDENSFMVRLVVGDKPLCSQFPGIFTIATAKNNIISSVLGCTNPFSWNLNFHCNLSDFEIGDLKRLMSPLSCSHLSPFLPNARGYSLSSSGSFTIKSFFLVLSNHINSIPFFLTDFVWKSQTPF